MQPNDVKRWCPRWNLDWPLEWLIGVIVVVVVHCGDFPLSTFFIEKTFGFSIEKTVRNLRNQKVIPCSVEK
jgi:hypothetical protein